MALEPKSIRMSSFIKRMPISSVWARLEQAQLCKREKIRFYKSRLQRKWREYDFFKSLFTQFRSVAEVRRCRWLVKIPIQILSGKKSGDSNREAFPRQWILSDVWIQWSMMIKYKDMKYIHIQFECMLRLDSGHKF